MIRLRQIDILVNNDSKKSILSKCAKKLGIKDKDIIDVNIVKKSIDARYKPNIYYSYIVDVDVRNEDKILKKRGNNDIFKSPKEEYHVSLDGTKLLRNRPIIVGAGPCGLFRAYMLASYGYKPLVIERGKCVDDRVKDVEDFWNKGILCQNSNIQFGEGGAGTFSDGKLNNLVKDKKFRQKKVFEIFVECGAPAEILYDAKPHIGTDLLRNIVKNMRNKIISMGGEFRFNTILTNININEGRVVSIVVNEKEVMDTGF